MVQINPLMRRATPTSSKEILHRINEITFNSSLASEMRAIEFISQLLDRGELTQRRRANTGRIHMHRIVLGEHKPLEPGSRLNNDFDFFETLHRAGKRAARRFLDAHFDDIGVRGTIEHDAKPRLRPTRRDKLAAWPRLPRLRPLFSSPKPAARSLRSWSPTSPRSTSMPS